MLNPNVTTMDLRGQKPEHQRKRSRRKRDILLHMKLLELEMLFDQGRPRSELQAFTTDMATLVRRMLDEERQEEQNNELQAGQPFTAFGTDR
ncbi:hypothetical protein [Primorskyibacter sedentarius]|uniref:hypothetical protein n=1 Tax=Primorskyibacter sedentarius TaxID=745311 RepID=UPI003EBAFBD2